MKRLRNRELIGHVLLGAAIIFLTYTLASFEPMRMSDSDFAWIAVKCLVASVVGFMGAAISVQKFFRFRRPAGGGWTTYDRVVIEVSYLKQLGAVSIASSFAIGYWALTAFSSIFIQSHPKTFDKFGPEIVISTVLASISASLFVLGYLWIIRAIPTPIPPRIRSTENGPSVPQT